MPAPRKARKIPAEKSTDVSSADLATATSTKPARAGGKRVLLVDDDTEIVESMRTVLESRGYEILVARDGNQGLMMAEKEEPDLVVLAGFMRVIKPGLLAAFAGKIINLHPSLLPSFPGLDGIGQAFRRGVKVTGCTVHGVTAEVDGGPILDQATVRVAPGETLETLAAKVHAAEHALLPAVIARLSEMR